jgi:hypothetical protein
MSVPLTVEERIGGGVLAIYDAAARVYRPVARGEWFELRGSPVHIGSATLRLSEPPAELALAAFKSGQYRAMALVLDEPLNGVNRPRGGIRVLRMRALIIEWQLLAPWEPGCELRLRTRGRVTRGFRLRLAEAQAAAMQQPAAAEAS